MTLLEQIEAAREDVQTCFENDQQARLELEECERKTAQACEHLEALLAAHKLTASEHNAFPNGRWG